MKGNRGFDPDNGFGEFGGYMNAKIAKLDDQFASEAAKNPFKKTDLFAGISIFVNGLTNPSADELKRIMMTHGGIYHTYQRSATTFIIAANLPDVKIRQSGKDKIINAQWIVDCLTENRILDYSKYLLYTEKKTNQPKISSFSTVQKTPKKENFAENLQTTNANVTFSENNTIQKGLNLLNKQILQSDVFKNEFSTEQSAVKPNETFSKNQARTAVDPKFLSEFYSNSRLHHIATLGAGFKEYIYQLREKHSGTFPAREDLLNEFLSKLNENQTNCRPLVMHIDMDCFFVSVGLRTRPHLCGQPVAVTHSKGASAGPSALRLGVDRQKEFEMYRERLNAKFKGDVASTSRLNSAISNTDSLSEIASCSYEARQMGVKNGMFVGAALKLCPNLKTIPYDFEAYKEVAFILYDTISKYTLDIEAVSCDEMYVDLANLIEKTGIFAEQFVTFVRNEIKTKTNCPCSAGIGANRLQARMATKHAKPNGQFFLDSDKVEEYFRDIAISDLPGVGYTTERKLLQLQWKTCEDLQQVPMETLQAELGKKIGEKLYQYCRGIDTKPLSFGHVRKSVSAEVNYGIRFTENEELENFLRQLTEEVHSRLTDIKRRGKCITLKYMVRAQDAPIETAKFMGHGLCDHITKSTTLNEFTSNLDVILKTVLSIKKTLNISPNELRGIGIQISKFDESNETATKINILKTMFEKVNEKNQVKNAEEKQRRTNKKEETRHSVSDRVLRNSSTKKPIGKSANGQTRRRGQGRGQGKGRQQQKDVSSMFSVPTLKSANTSNANIHSQLNLEILNELPEDIRKEVLKDYKHTKIKPTKVKNTHTKELEANQIDPEFLAALPFDIQQELLEHHSPEKSSSKSPMKTVKGFNSKMCATKTSAAVDKSKNSAPFNELITSQIAENCETFKTQISDDNILIKTNWKNVLKSWLDSSENPLTCDVEIVGQYAVELIQENQLHGVYVCLRYLHRIICDSEICTWHLAYYKIVEMIQNEMLSLKGGRLFIKQSFNCINCDIL